MRPDTSEVEDVGKPDGERRRRRKKEDDVEDLIIVGSWPNGNLEVGGAASDWLWLLQAGTRELDLT